jgi:galactose mutarotase-like enzyme
LAKHLLSSTAMSDSFCLHAGEARALFSPRGAECRKWQIGGRDLLWSGDETIWPAIAPVLFPTCGWSREGRIRISDREYSMPVHGFVAQSSFVAQQINDRTLCFTLQADARTRAHYPFEFGFVLTYRLEPFALSVSCEISNTGSGVMPYAVGLHPGFALDWSAGAHRFIFDEQEQAQVPVIAPGGLFSARQRPVPLEGRALDLSPDLFAAEALCFLDTRSRVFAMEAPDGSLRIEAPDFPHLILWNRMGGPFLAIESWTGTGDPEGFEGTFFERPSMIHLEPGASRQHHVRYAWQPLGRGQPSP